MGLEELRREILAQAQADAGRMVADARKEAQAILGAAREEADAKRRAADEETRRMMESLEKRELAATALEAKKMSMGAKKQVLDSVFEAASQALGRLKPEERRAVTQRLLRRAESEIDIGLVRCNARDKEFVAAYRSADADIMGGIVAESKDGAVRVDYSFETLLGEQRERGLEQLGRIVFKE